MERFEHGVERSGSPGDPLEAVHRHQVRRGPYRLRLAGAGIALGALTPAIWLPDAFAGAGTTDTVVAAVAGLLFLGLAANGAVLYRWARGYPPPDLPPMSPARQRAGFRRLLVLTAVPGALVVQSLRPWHRFRAAGWTSASGTARSRVA